MLTFLEGQEIIVGKYKIRNNDGIWCKYQRVGKDWYKVNTIPEGIYEQFKTKFKEMAI